MPAPLPTGASWQTLAAQDGYQPPDIDLTGAHRATRSIRATETPVPLPAASAPSAKGRAELAASYGGGAHGASQSGDEAAADVDEADLTPEALARIEADFAKQQNKVLRARALAQDRQRTEAAAAAAQLKDSIAAANERLDAAHERRRQMEDELRELQAREHDAERRASSLAAATAETELEHLAELRAIHRVRLEQISAERARLDADLKQQQYALEAAREVAGSETRYLSGAMRQLLARADALAAELEAQGAGDEALAAYARELATGEAAHDGARVIDDVLVRRAAERRQRELAGRSAMKRLNRERDELMQRREALLRSKAQHEAIASRGLGFQVDVAMGVAPPMPLVLANANLDERVEAMRAQRDDAEADEDVAETVRRTSERLARDALQLERLRASHEALVATQRRWVYEGQWGIESVAPELRSLYAELRAELVEAVLLAEVFGQVEDDTPSAAELAQIQATWEEQQRLLNARVLRERGKQLAHVVASVLVDEVVQETIVDVHRELLVLDARCERLSSQLLCDVLMQVGRTHDCKAIILESLSEMQRVKQRDAPEVFVHKHAVDVLPRARARARLRMDRSRMPLISRLFGEAFVSQPVPASEQAGAAASSLVFADGGIKQLLMEGGGAAGDVGGAGDGASGGEHVALVGPDVVVLFPESVPAHAVEKIYVEREQRYWSFVHLLADSVVGERGGILAVAISPNSRSVAVATTDGAVAVYARTNLALSLVRLLPRLPAALTRLAWTADGTRLLGIDTRRNVVWLSLLHEHADLSPQPGGGNGRVVQAKKKRRSETVVTKNGAFAVPPLTPLVELPSAAFTIRTVHARTAGHTLRHVPVAVAAHPSLTVLGTQPSFVVGLGDGELVKVNTALVAAAVHAAPLMAEHQHSLGDDVRAELFKAHRAPIVLIGFIRGSTTMVTADAAGCVCIWPYETRSFSGFGWFHPRIKTRLFLDVLTFAPVPGSQRVCLFASETALMHEPWVQASDVDRRGMHDSHKRAVRELAGADLHREPWMEVVDGGGSGALRRYIHMRRSDASWQAELLADLHAQAGLNSTLTNAPLLAEAAERVVLLHFLSFSTESKLEAHLTQEFVSTTVRLRVLDVQLASHGSQLIFMLFCPYPEPRKPQVAFVVLDLDRCELVPPRIVQPLDAGEAVSFGAFAVSSVLPGLSSEYLYAVINNTLHVYSLLSGLPVRDPLQVLPRYDMRTLCGISLADDHSFVVFACAGISTLLLYHVEDKATDAERSALQRVAQPWRRERVPIELRTSRSHHFAFAATGRAGELTTNVNVLAAISAIVHAVVEAAVAAAHSSTRRASAAPSSARREAAAAAAAATEAEAEGEVKAGVSRAVPSGGGRSMRRRRAAPRQVDADLDAILAGSRAATPAALERAPSVRELFRDGPTPTARRDGRRRRDSSED